MLVLTVLLAPTTESAFATGRPQVIVVTPCDSPETDPWVTALRARIVSFDALARYAIQLYGPPEACEGSVSLEFDGEKFGVLRLDFPGSASLRIETMPPEASVLMFSAEVGFEDEAAARISLESYALSRGLDIDWSNPTVEGDSRTRIETFWDPQPGVNGSVTLHFVEDILVGLGLNLAP